MMSPRALLVPTFLLAALASTPVWADETAFVTDSVVRSSIKRGVDSLLRDKNPQGTWETGTKFIDDQPLYGAETSLCLYALLHVGESMDDPRLKPGSKELAAAVKFVANLRPETTYTASLQACALVLCPPKDPAVREGIIRAKNYLVQSTLARGGHNYSLAQALKEPGVYDHSNSNYALMGLAAIDAADIPGITIPSNFWTTYEAMWQRDQNQDGGWGYAPNKRPESYATMTAAGLASLLLCRQFTRTEATTTVKADKAIENAMTRLAQAYDPTSQNLYYVFTLERIGLAGGVKHIGNWNWYKEGAATLIKVQKPDGSWFLEPGSFLIANITSNIFSSYALMFLSRGSSPILFNKLQYNGSWDARPRDDANVTAWVAKTFERPLAWQTVALKANDDWSDAPVLLITGSRNPNFTPEEVAMLKAYADAGGIIFSTADNASDDFTKAVKKYAAEVAGDQAAWRDLPSDHPLFNIWAKIDRPPKLAGVSNGAREVWVHCPTDLGSAWQRNAKELKASFEVAGNFYYYATGKGSLGYRLDTLIPRTSKDAPVRSISLARVKYGGNWDPEPGAWPRMAKIATNFHTTLTLETVSAAALDAGKTPIAHLTGTAAVRFDDDAQAGLKKFVEGGGTLFIDAVGGNKAFTDSVKSALAVIFKDQPLAPIPPEHALFTADTPDATKIETVEWRKYTRVRDGNPPDDKPRLQGIKVGDRYAVIFSHDDITSGLLGSNTWGIAGYAPATAQSLVRNILLSAKPK